MTTARQTQRRRLALAAVFVTAMLSITMQGEVARAEPLVPDGYRVGAAMQKFDGTWQLAAIYNLRPPRRLRSSHLEFAIGMNTTPAESRAFVSLGPVWRYPLPGHGVVAEFGFSPTLLAGSTYNGRDMGGNVHFTSSAAIAATFGERRALSVALRLQHTSNAGLHRTNPGMDIVALSVRYDFNL